MQKQRCEQKVSNVFDQFGITIPCSVTYFLEVGALLSLRVATKESIKGKATIKRLIYGCFLKQKGRSATKKFKMFLINFASLYLAQLNIFLK